MKGLPQKEKPYGKRKRPGLCPGLFYVAGKREEKWRPVQPGEEKGGKREREGEKACGLE